MKTRILVSSILIMAVAGLMSFKYFSSSSPEPVKNLADSISYTERFLIGSMETIGDSQYNYVHYDSLGLNLWQAYLHHTESSNGIVYPKGQMSSGDTLFAPVNSYSAELQSEMAEIYSHNETRLLMTRPKIEWLCYGQRSDYQCEQDHIDAMLWFYSFQTAGHVGGVDSNDNRYGNGAWVRYFRSQNSNCSGSWVDPPGVVISKLKANTEQCRIQPSNEKGGRWQYDNQFFWKIKPRIRIDPVTVSTNPMAKVCRIILRDDSNRVTKEAIIRARNFVPGQDSSYSGDYIEEYFFEEWLDTSNLVTTSGPWGKKNMAFWQARGNNISIDTSDQNFNHTDIQIYWYGECDMWIDYVRVDNEIADKLLTSDSTDPTHVAYETWINDEVEQIALYRPLQADMPPAYKLYLELTEFNNLPCMAYVNRRLKYYATQLGGSQFKVDLAADFHFRYSIHVPWENKSTVMNYDHIKRFWIDSVGMTTFLAECYPFNNNESPVTDSSVGRIPETLKRTQCQGSDPCDIFARAVPPADFDDWLQDNLDHDPYYFASDNEQFTVKEALWQRGLSRFTLNLGDKISRVCNIPFILMPQLHSWFLDNVEIHFEPTNELIDLITNLGISRGARGLILYAWNSNKDNPSESEYSRGLTEREGNLRQQNVYQQEKTKKQTVIDLVNRVEKWEPYLMSFDNANRKAFTYQNQTEREQMIAGTFIRQLLTYPCISYAPDTIPDLDNIQLDAQNKTYLEATFFANPFDGGREKYFMLVNRRCSPFYNFTSADSIGGRRILAMKTNASGLEGFNNWKLIDIESGRHIITFDKNDTGVIFTGDIMPGAAKLYKLAPVMQEGGTLVADEDCGGFEFECRGEVNNNGHDITIVPNTTILFANTTARIVMNGGSFYAGSSSESYPIYLNAKTGASWKGLKLGGCEEVELHQTYFNGVSPYPVDSTYAAELTDCSSINISNCTFSSLSTGKTGSLLIAYSSQGDPEGVYLSSNYFNLNTGSMPAISVIATGYDEVPLLMEWNEFESCSENSTLAILLSNVTGGAIKENNFTGYDKTGFMLGSSIDFYGNYIIGSDQSSVGIVQHSASNANLSASGEMFTGGFNSVTAEGQTAKCIQLNNSYLLIDEGYNIFRLEDSQTNNYHLEGTIPNDVGADPYPAENNCFQLGNGLLVKHNLRWIDETAINLDTVPSSCNSERPESFMVFNLGNGINDTVRYESGGSGGGESNVKLEIKNYKYGEASGAGSISESVTLKTLSDSVSINLRRRDYERVSVLCREMLTDYEDSINDASIISKLYLADLKQDTGSSRMSELKSFLESYILNNPEKEMMVRQAFYFIQKCKVSLGLYESAMTGFQQIINQFPYSYEGLLASWDYAATSLLNSQGGSGGGARSKYDHDLRDEGVVSYIDDPNDVYDSRKFSTDDRKTLNDNLTKTFSSQVNKQTREIKSLEEKVTKNEATNSEKKKYQEMRTLKEIIKARKPETIAGHVSMISDDLSRIMKSTSAEYLDKHEANILPTEFALHQNYPNPFNPATKISFDLPQDSKVNLIVYDLLGREVKRLVNNEFKVAGKYTYDFNAASLSSGVYFYRLETEGFVNTKRMMLIK